MVEKNIGNKNGKIHFELDVEFPELKNLARDFVDVAKKALDEVVDTGKKVVSKKDKNEDKDIKQVKIK